MLTLSDVIREISELSVRSQRLDSDYKGFVNRAQRQLCERFSFTWMHDIPSVTIAAGATSAALPDNWKELDSEDSAASYTLAPDGRRIPVRVIGRAEMERMGTVFNNPNPANLITQYVFLEQQGGANWTVNLPTPNPNSGSVTINLSGYLFPQQLSAGTDSNALFSGGEITEALINKTKAIAYSSEDETDPRAAASEALAERHFLRAMSADKRRKLAGRKLSM